MYGYIYKTTNLVNGKIYIGQKKSNKFLENKYLGSGKRLKQAIIKYGVDNFSVEVLEEIDDESLMDEREIYWISFYNSTNGTIGYNISAGGNVNRTMIGENNPRYGVRLTQEQKIKHREALKKRNLFGDNNPSKKPENRKKISEALKGHSVSEEEKQKLRYYNTHKIYITNGEINKTILPEYLSEWEEKGFYIGRVKHKKPKTIWINNGEIQKLIFLSELEDYKEKGFSRGRIKIPGRKAWNSGLTKETDSRCKKLGRGMRGSNNPMYGRKRRCLYNDSSCVLVNEELVQQYLDNGYKFGRKTLSKKGK